jgi:hypothetical protein
VVRTSHAKSSTCSLTQRGPEEEEEEEGEKNKKEKV